MKFQIGAMTVGDILDRGLKLLLARLPTFYAINLIVLTPLIVLQVLMPFLMRNEENIAAAALLSLFLLLVVLILTLVLQPIGTAAILHIISQEFIDRRVGLGTAFRFALSRFGPLLGASILVGLMVGFGMLLCFVPGLIFMTWYAFVPQVVVLEGQGVTDSMERSKRLSEGYRWRIFGIIFLIQCVLVMINLAIGLALNFALPASDIVPVAGGGIRAVAHPGNQAIQALVSQLIGIFLAAFQAVCITLLYFDIRIRKEGYDLELAAQAQDTSKEATDLPAADVDLPEA